MYGIALGLQCTLEAVHRFFVSDFTRTAHAAQQPNFTSTSCGIVHRIYQQVGLLLELEFYFPQAFMFALLVLNLAQPSKCVVRVRCRLTHKFARYVLVHIEVAVVCTTGTPRPLSSLKALCLNSPLKLNLVTIYYVQFHFPT